MASTSSPEEGDATSRFEVEYDSETDVFSQNGIEFEVFLPEADDATPRRNPKRSCLRKKPWKFDNEDESGENEETSDEEDFEDADFHIYTTTCNGQISACKTSKFAKKFERDYDPDDDAFIQDRIKLDFNADSLKTDIQHFMKTSGVPAYKRAIKKWWKKIALTTPHRRPYKKRNPSVRKKREVEPAVSDDTPEVVAPPTYPLKRTPESTLRAMISTRDILNRMAQKRKEAAAKNAITLSDERKNVNESEILKGVVAFVDVISHTDEDISSVVRKELEKLGAVVLPTFTKKDPVSIILFNDGHVSTYKKAKQRGIPLVSVLWIEECRRIGAQVPADKFPAHKMERYEIPEFVKEMKKRKLLYASERMNPPKQRKRPKQTEENASPVTPEHESQSITSSEDASDGDLHGPAWLNEIEGSNGMMRILVNMTKITQEEFKEMMNEPDDSEKYEISPLPMRLLHKLARELSAKKSSNSDSELVTTSRDSENVQAEIPTIAEESLLEEDLTSDENSDANECFDINFHDFATYEEIDEIATALKKTPVTRKISTGVYEVRRVLSYSDDEGKM